MNPPLMPPTEGFAEPTNPSRMMERTLTLGGSEVFEAPPLKEDTAVKRSFQHIEKPKEGAELELSSSKRRKVDVEPSSSSSSTAMLTTKADRVYGKAVDKPLPVSDTINNPSAATSMVKPSSVTGGIATKQPTDSVAPTPATSNLGNPINKAIVVVSNVPPELEFSVKEVVSGRGRKKAVPAPAPAPVDKVSEKGDPVTAKSTIDKPPTHTSSNIPIAVEAAIPAAEAAIDAPLQLTAVAVTRKKAKKDTEVIGNPPTATATTLKDVSSTITTTADVHTDRDKDGTRGSRSKGSPAASPLSAKATRNAKPALALTTIEEDDHHEVHRTSDMAAANSNSALTSIDDTSSRGSRSKPNKLSTTATATSTASQIDPPRQTNRRNQSKVTYIHVQHNYIRLHFRTLITAMYGQPNSGGIGHHGRTAGSRWLVHHRSR